MLNKLKKYLQQKSSFSPRHIPLTLFLILFLLFALAFTIYLSQQRQVITPKAATLTDYSAIGGITFMNSRNNNLVTNTTDKTRVLVNLTSPWDIRYDSKPYSMKDQDVYQAVDRP